ncbi:MAG: FecR domain-containing protein, partial [Planctomycetota bacterium]
MSQESSNNDRAERLIDEYLDGTIDDSGLKALEQMLVEDASLREYFVSLSATHTNLFLESRARSAGQSAMRRALAGDLTDQSEAKIAQQRRWAAWIPAVVTIASCLLIGIWLFRQPTAGSPTIAWLANGQNCVWEDQSVASDLSAGSQLRLQSGLAELCFRSGARMTLQGPVHVELLSETSTRVLEGRVAVRVPEHLTGFEVLSKDGRIVDLGTEFGVYVKEDSPTNVVVFDGSVRVIPKGVTDNQATHLVQDQSAQLVDSQVTFDSTTEQIALYTRKIQVPPRIVPRTLQLDFDQATVEHEGCLSDKNGHPIGLNSRLPGTGQAIEELDPNLDLNLKAGQLILKTTRSDINRQVKLPLGEYIGINLSQLGFTGSEDFVVSAVILDIPNLEDFGQFGLYAGNRSDQIIRGGFIKFSYDKSKDNTAFMVNNHGGNDSDGYRVGLLSAGDDLVLSLARKDGRYSLKVENLSEGGTSTLTIKHPEFLDDVKELQVGLFGANPYNDVQKPIQIDSFSVTVWTEAGPEKRTE